MDKILSARIDESIHQRITLLAHELNTTKKAVIESAILRYSESIEKEGKMDILQRTCGAWQRREEAGETVRKVRETFQKSQERYKR